MEGGSAERIPPGAEPSDVIYGNPSDVDDLVVRLRAYARAFKDGQGQLDVLSLMDWGVRQTDPDTGDPKIFEGRKKHEAPWKDSLEYRVPHAKDPENSRILMKELPDGRKVMGWTTDHYRTIHPFTAPHFPDDGWN